MFISSASSVSSVVSLFLAEFVFFGVAVSEISADKMNDPAQSSG